MPRSPRSPKRGDGSSGRRQSAPATGGAVGGIGLLTVPAVMGSSPDVSPKQKSRRSKSAWDSTGLEHTLASISGFMGETMQNSYMIDELAMRGREVQRRVRDLKGCGGSLKVKQLQARYRELCESHTEVHRSLRKLVTADREELLGGAQGGEHELEVKHQEVIELMQHREEMHERLEIHLESLKTFQQELLIAEEARTKREAEIDAEEQQSTSAENARREAERWLKEAETRAEKMEGVEREFEEYTTKCSEAESGDVSRRMEIGTLQHELEQSNEELQQQAEVAASLARDLQHRKAELKRLQHRNIERVREIEVVEADGAALHATYRHELAILKKQLDEQTKRAKEWEEFEAGNPGHSDLEEQLSQKPATLLAHKQHITDRHTKEAEVSAGLHQGWRELEEVRAVLEAATSDAEQAVSQVVSDDHVGLCAPATLVSCYPDPCPVGHSLGLVITTCDINRRPTVGADASEFRVERIILDAFGPARVVGATPVQEVSDAGGPSSTFTCDFLQESDGRAGFRVHFRGETFVVSACIPPPPPPMLREVMETTQPRTPTLTVHCSPGTVTLGSRVEVAVVMREPGSLLPAKESTLAAEGFNVSSYGMLYGKRPPQLQQLHEGSPVYWAEFDLPQELKQGGVRQHVGVEVMTANGSDAARASVRLISDTTAEVDTEATQASICCTPDPVVVGERVHVYISARNTFGFPVPAGVPGPPPVVQPVGTATFIERPIPASTNRNLVWTAAFTADRVGRAGISATFPGVSAVARRASVEVVHAGEWVPEKTELILTPSVVQLGETIAVTVRTRDADGRPSPGPPPEAFELTKLGGSCDLARLRRTEGSLSEYCAVLRTGGSSLDRPLATVAHAGCTVVVQGHSITARAKVSGKPLDAHAPQPAASKFEAPGPPKLYATFQSGEVTVGGEVQLLIAAHEDAPARGGRSVPTPSIATCTNCEVLSPPVGVPGSRFLWRAQVRVGDRPGTASVDVDFAPIVVHCSTTVVLDRWGGVDLALHRLEELAAAVRTRALTEEHRAASLKLWEAELLRREQIVQAQERGEQTAKYVQFGLQLSDGISYGGIWEGFAGCKVLEVLPESTVANAQTPDRRALGPGDFITRVQWENPITHATIARNVPDLESFRQTCDDLASDYPLGDLPPVTLRCVQGGRADGSSDVGREFSVITAPEKTNNPPGRYIGTLRHSTQHSIEQACSGSPQRMRGQGSPRRSTSMQPVPFSG
eukprot:Hpha_TRINITY_DN15494_c2_g11::TRINITY_DN15494_c2_g11_i1::g.177229::m.177229